MLPCWDPWRIRDSKLITVVGRICDASLVTQVRVCDTSLVTRALIAMLAPHRACLVSTHSDRTNEIITLDLAKFVSGDTKSLVIYPTWQTVKQLNRSLNDAHSSDVAVLYGRLRHLITSNTSAHIIACVDTYQDIPEYIPAWNHITIVTCNQPASEHIGLWQNVFKAYFSNFAAFQHCLNNGYPSACFVIEKGKGVYQFTPPIEHPYAYNLHTGKYTQCIEMLRHDSGRDCDTHQVHWSYGECKFVIHNYEHITRIREDPLFCHGTAPCMHHHRVPRNRQNFVVRQAAQSSVRSTWYVTGGVLPSHNISRHDKALTGECKAATMTGSTLIWRKMSPMRFPRAEHCAVAVEDQDCIFVAGGHPQPPRGFMERYDILTDTWRTMPHPPNRFDTRYSGMVLVHDFKSMAC